jgi:hypothetical protein
MIQSTRKKIQDVRTSFLNSIMNPEKTQKSSAMKKVLKIWLRVHKVEKTRDDITRALLNNGFEAMFGEQIRRLSDLATKNMQDTVFLNNISLGDTNMGEFTTRSKSPWYVRFMDKFGIESLRDIPTNRLNYRVFTDARVTEIQNMINSGLDDMSVQQRVFFSTVLAMYFKPAPSMIPIQAWHAYNIANSDNFMYDYITSGGPMMIKIIQQFGSSDISIHGYPVTEYVSQSFENTPGLLEPERTMVINHLINTEILSTGDNYKFFASASIAQAIKVLGKDERMIKIIKPMSAFYFLCEVDFLLTEVWSELTNVVAKLEGHQSKANILVGCRRLMLYLISEFCLEFDYEKEKENLEALKPRYESRKANYSVTVPRAMSGYTRNNDGKFKIPFIVQELARGTSLVTYMRSGLSSDDRLQLSLTLQKFLQVWFFNIINGDSKFHADLHPGNVFVESPTQIAIIDFGSTGHMKSNDIYNFLHVAGSCAGLYDLHSMVLPLMKKNGLVSHTWENATSSKVNEIDKATHTIYFQVEKPWEVTLHSIIIPLGPGQQPIEKVNFRLKNGGKSDTLIVSGDISQTELKEVWNGQRAKLQFFALKMLQRTLSPGSYSLTVTLERETELILMLPSGDTKGIALFIDGSPMSLHLSASRIQTEQVVRSNVRGLVPEFISEKTMSCFLAAEQEQILEIFHRRYNRQCHDRNVKMSRGILSNLDIMCSVNSSDTITSTQILNYNDKTDLSNVFKTFVRVSETVGSCVSNGSILLSRAIAHFDKTLRAISPGNETDLIAQCLARSVYSSVKAIRSLLFRRVRDWFTLYLMYSLKVRRQERHLKFNTRMVK